MNSLKTLVALLALVPAAHAVTLDFESLSGSGAVPSNYAGLDWSSGWNHYHNPDAPYLPSSGTGRVYNEFGNLGVIRFNADVTFQGLWMAGYGYDQYVEGYRDGVKLFESVHMPSGEATFGVFVELDWASIDEIRIQSANWGYNHYVIDDLTFQPEAIREPLVLRTAVPEGGVASAMLMAGMAAVTVARRRASKAA